MSNTDIKATKVADTAVETLRRELVLGGLVARFGNSDFMGAYNDTITARLQAVATGRTAAMRAAATLSTDDLTENSFSITLSRRAYSKVNLYDEQLTLDVYDYVHQVQFPQVRAVAQVIDDAIATAMEAADYATAYKVNWGAIADAAGTPNYMAPYRAIVTARQKLNEANVPTDGRVLVLGTAVEAEVLKSDLFARVDMSGTDSALRRAQTGSILGFDVYVSNAIDPENAYAMHPTAFLLGLVAPRNARGASESGQIDTAVGGAPGIGGLRQTFGFNMDVGYTQSLVDGFYGVTSVLDGAGTKMVRAVKLEYFSGS